MLGFQEKALVDSKDPDAKPLPVDEDDGPPLPLLRRRAASISGPGGCLGDGFIGGRGEEHPNGRFDNAWPADAAGAVRHPQRDARRRGARVEPLTAMVMNHYKRPKRFYVRTSVWYTTEPRTPALPADDRQLRPSAERAWATTCPAAARPARRSWTARTWTVPFSGRILGGGSHHHGGALHQTLRSVTCGRTLFDAKAYYGADDHPYNTIRPILHEPGPIANGTFRTRAGHPGHRRRGARARGRARQRQAARRGDGLLGACSSSATTRVTPCAPMPTDLREVTMPAKYDQRAPYVYDRRRAAAVAPSGTWQRVHRRPVAGRRPVLQAAAADRARSASGSPGSFGGSEPHSVTRGQRPARLLLELPRQYARLVLLHAHRAGHLPAHVPDPPDDDEPDAQGQTLLKKFRPRPSSHSWALMLSVGQLAGEEHHAHRDQDHEPESAVMIR